MAVIATCKMLGFTPLLRSTLNDLCNTLTEKNAQTIVISSHQYVSELEVFVTNQELRNTTILSAESLNMYSSHEENVTKNLASCSSLSQDISTCCQIIKDHVYSMNNTEAYSAAVFTSPGSSTMAIAVSLLCERISLKLFTYEHFQQLTSTVEQNSKSKTRLIVLPEVILPDLLPIIVQCECIQQVWVHGMPFGVAHIANFTTLCPKIFVTHSLIPGKCYISHYLKLRDTITLINNECAYIQIGSVCQNLQWRLLHKDGRPVQSGYMGEFVASIDGHEYHSGVLVRQHGCNSLQELLALDSVAYYKGQDTTKALTVLSKFPEVTWCQAATDQDRIHCTSQLCYTVDINSIHHS